LGLLGQLGGSGTGTIYFDNASLSIVPEPATIAVIGIALMCLPLRLRPRSAVQ
jgi:hypothetical protein